MQRNFLEEAEAIRLKIENSNPLDPKLEQEFKEFMIELNAYISAYSRIVTRLKREHENIDHETNEFCFVRNLMNQLKGKKNAE